MFCPNCGKQIPEGSRFCENCGTPVRQQEAPAQQPVNQQPAYQQPAYQQPYQGPVYAGNGAVREGIPAPGFSDRVNHPEVLAAVKKNRGIAKIFAFILVPLPLVGVVIFALVTGKLEIGKAALYGGIISAVFLLFALISFFKERAANTYEAVVTDQRTERTYRHNRSKDGRDMVTQYTTVARTTDGKKKTIVEYDYGRIWAYRYLHVGDRFRYHPQFAYPYELYDKSHADGIYCVSCQTKNPVTADRCKKCGVPLLK